jgi:hypothetical protein
MIYTHSLTPSPFCTFLKGSAGWLKLTRLLCYKMLTVFLRIILELYREQETDTIQTKGQTLQTKNKKIKRWKKDRRPIF